MSFVGPRALRPGEIEIEGGHRLPLEAVPGYADRIVVRPGLTGVAQVYAPRDISRRRKFRYDRLYIQPSIVRSRYAFDSPVVLDKLPRHMGIQGPQVLTPGRRDVIVVGGGPAGLLAARDLAASGFSTIVVEEHETIGVPVHCTGVLGMDAFDELDLPRHTILHTAHAARFISADGSSLLIDHDRVRAAIIDRGEIRRSAGGECCRGRAQRFRPVAESGRSMSTPTVSACRPRAGSRARTRLHHCLRRELSIQPAPRSRTAATVRPQRAARGRRFLRLITSRCTSDVKLRPVGSDGSCRFDAAVRSVRARRRDVRSAASRRIQASWPPASIDGSVSDAHGTSLA